MTDQPQDLQALLLRGIALARSGKKDEARAIFEQVIRADQYNEQAWLWLASVARSTPERREALEIVLEINPANQQARAALEHLGGPRARRKADAARAIADRIGAEEAPTEQDFQPVVERPAEAPAPEPEPEPTPEEKEAALARTLIESARAERAAAEPDDSAPEAEEESGPTVEVIDVEQVRQQRTARLLTAILAVFAVGIAVVLLAQSIPPLLTGGPTPTDSFATRIARLATVTPTYDTGVIVTAQPGRDLNVPPTWTPSPTATVTVTPPATTTPLPPSSYTLIFSRREAGAGAYALYTARGDGAQVTALTDGTGDDRDPAPGPDGARVLFVTEIDGRRQVVLLMLDGAAPTPQPSPTPADEPADEEEAPLPTEAPPPPDPEAGPIPLTRITASNVSAPSWSPDGYRFVFSANLDGDEEIYLSDVDGSSFVQLTRNTHIDRDPAWSPAGDRIVFASDRDGEGQLELYAIRPDGTDVLALTNSQGSSFAPAWSPDGTQIVFVSDRDRDADLYIMRADGANETLLTRDDEGAEDRAPAWSPDGRWIVFSSNRDSENFRLFLIDPYVGRVIPVTIGAHDDLGAAWLRR